MNENLEVGGGNETLVQFTEDMFHDDSLMYNNSMSIDNYSTIMNNGVNINFNNESYILESPLQSPLEFSSFYSPIEGLDGVKTEQLYSSSEPNISNHANSVFTASRDRNTGDSSLLPPYEISSVDGNNNFGQCTSLNTAYSTKNNETQYNYVQPQVASSSTCTYHHRNPQDNTGTLNDFQVSFDDGNQSNIGLQFNMQQNGDQNINMTGLSERESTKFETICNSPPSELLLAYNSSNMNYRSMNSSPIVSDDRSVRHDETSNINLNTVSPTPLPASFQEVKTSSSFAIEDIVNKESSTYSGFAQKSSEFLNCNQQTLPCFSLRSNDDMNDQNSTSLFDDINSNAVGASDGISMSVEVERMIDSLSNNISTVHNEGNLATEQSSIPARSASVSASNRNISDLPISTSTTTTLFLTRTTFSKPKIENALSLSCSSKKAKRAHKKRKHIDNDGNCRKKLQLQFKSIKKRRNMKDKEDNSDRSGHGVKKTRDRRVEEPHLHSVVQGFQNDLKNKEGDNIENQLCQSEGRASMTNQRSSSKAAATSKRMNDAFAPDDVFGLSKNVEAPSNQLISPSTNSSLSKAIVTISNLIPSAMVTAQDEPNIQTQSLGERNCNDEEEINTEAKKYSSESPSDKNVGIETCEHDHNNVQTNSSDDDNNPSSLKDGGNINERENRKSDDNRSSSKCSSLNNAPSRFCHICTRSTKPHEVLTCGNVKKGSCRKVICHRCLTSLSVDWRVISSSDDWICTHCRKVGLYIYPTFLVGYRYHNQILFQRTIVNTSALTFRIVLVFMNT